MNRNPDVERLLATWLDEQIAQREPPDLLGRVLDATNGRRRRPAWLALLTGNHLSPTTSRPGVYRHRSERPMNGDLRLVAGLAAIAITAAVGLATASSKLNLGAAATTQPSTTPTVSAAVTAPLVWTFRAANFDGGLAVRVPARWTNPEDSYFTYELVGPAGPAAGSITVYSSSQLATNDSARCAASPNASLKITAGLSADRRLVSSGLAPITVGDREGEMLDLRLAPDWTAGCPWSNGQPAAVLLTRRGPPVEIRISGEERMRLIVIDHLGGCCTNVITVHAPDEASFNAFLPQAMRIVDAFEFGGGEWPE